MRVSFNVFNVMSGGVCRKGGRGFPDCIAQNEVTKKDELEAARGIVKVASSGDIVAAGSLFASTIIAVSFYDSKPVYLMTTSMLFISMLTKQRKVWKMVLQHG